MYASTVQMTQDPDWLEALLEERARTFRDEFGSFYAWLEGAIGGETVLLWMPTRMAEAVIQALPKRFKGRLVLGLDRSAGHAAPFGRALYWAEPRRVLIVQTGEGLGTSFAGRKETAQGEWMDWDNPAEARTLEIAISPGFSYTEHRAYVPWNAPPLAGLPTPEGPAIGGVGWGEGIPTYGLGLVGLSQNLEAILGAWRLV